MNPQKPESSPVVTVLQTKIDRVSRSISDQQSRLARGSQRTALIGGIICLIIAGWFYYGYYMLGELLQPKRVVALAERQIIDRLPEQRQELERIVAQNAPEWARMASEEVQKNMPTVREHMEKFVVEKADQELDKLTIITAGEFRKFVNENRQVLAEGFTYMKDKRTTPEFVQQLADAVENSFASDMREQADELFHTLILLNAKLTTLKDGKGLDTEQNMERSALMIAKRLQVDSARGEEEVMESLRPDNPPAVTPESKGKSGAAEKPAGGE
jgi:hypothetical protein